MRTNSDHGKLAVAVRKRLGRPGQPLFRPGGVAEMNKQVTDNLDKIIATLEAEDEDSGQAAGDAA